MVIQFSKKEAILFGWKTARANLRFFVVVLLIAGAVEYVPQLLLEAAKKAIPTAIFFLLYVMAIVAQIVVGMGLIKIAVTFADERKPTYADLINPYSLFFKYLGASLIYILAVAAGMVLLLVPGIILAIRLQFYNYFIIEQEAGPIEAVKKSFAITRTVTWNLLLFGLLLGGIILAGFLALFVGLFLAIPTTIVASAFVYKKLLSQVFPS